MLCSPAEGLPQCRLLETFSSFVTDVLSALVSCMRQAFLSPSIECNPLLPWGEDVENDRREGNMLYHSDTCDSKSCLLYTSEQFCSLWGSLDMTEYLPLQGEHLTMPATEVSGTSTEAPAIRVMSYLLGHLWTTFILLYPPHMVVNFYISVHLDGYKWLVLVFISI